ncbi:FkbM family methyltransferase [Methylocystis sp.]|uniref:FkbM family methyltransferase n=1 Tax=Methylocystis sp. TaxID=1911079 RepID=UPI002734241B|nr:FkbM family methyltransferase [Methylocystis sp.]MDP3552790.1 FkbM family methyltransferase [Methylocystis sp.]
MWISYAQNFEDVMLERAFGGLAEGFYVDVGAWDPDLESVTRHFYERGWRGVNVEPNPYYFRRLQERRPRDVNLSVAVGARASQATMTLVHDTGMSSLDANVAASHAPLGFEQEEMQVEVRTLNSIFEEQAPSTVHFLKIDCEGSERDVIVEFDLGRFRPWIILVESVAPGAARTESHSSWEPHILRSDYVFAYFDGLNRFYVAREHADLQKHFAVPPNVFDDFYVDRMMQMGLALEAKRKKAAKKDRAAWWRTPFVARRG